MTLCRTLWAHMETQAFVLGLLVLWIYGIFTFPLISEEDEIGDICDYSKPDSNYAGKEKNKGWEVKNKANIVSENDAGQSENVKTLDTDFEPDGSILKTRYYVYEDQNEEPSDEEQFKATKETTDSSLFDQTVSAELGPSDLAEETISQNIKKSKMKRSSLFDNLQEEDDETTNDGEESKTEKGDNVQESAPSTNSLNTLLKETTPKPWFWSWLFKSSHPEQRDTERETETENVVDKESSGEESTNNCKVMETFPQTKSSETAEETIKNLESESDHYDQEKNNTGEGCGCNVGKTCEMGNSVNFTTQIHNEEAILEQEIMEQNPGITTTEAVWNTDEFIARTSK